MFSVRIPFRSILSTAVLLSLCLSLFPVGSSQAAAPVPRINWSRCYREFGFPFECATVPVPLDYSNPGAASILISVVRFSRGSSTARMSDVWMAP